MALSMHEQRMLEQIEQRLADEDPRLASVFSRFAAAHRRLIGPRHDRPAVVSSVSYLPTRSSKRSSAVETRVAGRRWGPWAVLAAGAGVLVLGVVLGQVAVALAGSLLVAATPLLIPVCTHPHRLRSVRAQISSGSSDGHRTWWRRARTSREQRSHTMT